MTYNNAMLLTPTARVAGLWGSWLVDFDERPRRSQQIASRYAARHHRLKSMTFEKVFVGVGTVTVSFVGLFFLFLVSYAFWPDVRDYVAPQEFTVEHWREAGYENLDTGYYRWRMRHSLMREHDLVGMSRREIEALLGPADPGTPLFYNLGPTGRGIEYGVLELRLNGNDMVERFEFRRH